MEFSVIPARIQMERFISVECFWKKVIPFEAFPFSRFDRNARKFLYHLSTITTARENRPFHLFLNWNNSYFWQFPFSFSKYRTCSTICRNILTENFIQMVSAPDKLTPTLLLCILKRIVFLKRMTTQDPVF